MLSCFSHVWLCATLWTAGHQAPLPTGFSRQEYWSGLPFPSPSFCSRMSLWALRCDKDCTVAFQILSRLHQPTVILTIIRNTVTISPGNKWLFLPQAVLLILQYIGTYVWLSCFSCARLCDPMDCSPPGSSVHGLLQARMLEWVAMHARSICYSVKFPLTS